MEKVTTLFLKIAVILLGVPVLALCIFLVSEMANLAAKLLPEFAFIKHLVFIAFEASAIPFYFVLLCIRLSNSYATLTKIKLSPIYL